MFDRTRAVGAIARPPAARLDGLDVVAERIAGHESTETRFVVLARELHTGPADKGSMVLATDDRSGARVQALGAFADHRVNLSRIESRPAAGGRGRYTFLIDFAGDPGNDDVARALSALGSQGVSYRILGFYPSDHGPATAVAGAEAPAS
jgi:chorismate mutase/prephenate dehydratase